MNPAETSNVPSVKTCMAATSKHQTRICAAGWNFKFLLQNKTAAQCWAAVLFWSKNLEFHPAAQILAWCLLVAAMQVLTLGTLLVSAGFIFLLALLVSAHKLMQLLRRTRWIMLSLLLIYAYSTPGQPLLDALGVLSPSREGLGDGVLPVSYTHLTLPTIL